MTNHKHDPALVETVARAIADIEHGTVGGFRWIEYRQTAIAALDAARPAIRREALEDIIQDSFSLYAIDVARAALTPEQEKTDEV